MTKQYIENQQNASRIKSFFTNRADPILQNNHSDTRLRRHAETSRYYSNIEPIDDLNKKLLRKPGLLSTSASDVFSPNQSSIKETRRKDLRSQYEAKNHKIRINKIKTVESSAKEDHLESNMIPLASASPVNKVQRNIVSNERIYLPSDEYKKMNIKQFKMNPEKNGKRQISTNPTSIFNNLFNHVERDCKKEQKKKKNISSFKSSINSLIKYEYGQGHLYPLYEYATKPNNVKYNTLIKYHNISK